MVLAKAEPLAKGGTAVTTARICTVCIVGANAEVSSRVAALLENQRDRFVAQWEMADHASADLLLVDAVISTMPGSAGPMPAIREPQTGQNRRVQGWPLPPGFV